METTTEQNFIRHLLQLINDRMKEIAPMSKSNEFDKGMALAYLEVGGFIQECCNIFNISPDELHLKDFNPDRLL